MLISPGDEISVREGSRKRTYFKQLAEKVEGTTLPMWLERDIQKMTGGVLRKPERSEIDGNLNEQLIVEYYSR